MKEIDDQGLVLDPGVALAADRKVLVRSFGSEMELNTLTQAMRTARLPIMAGPVALQADAHVGHGTTVGSVLVTDGAIIPSACGVDLGCVDGETEYLSPSGWQRIDTYAGGEVMQYHPETGMGEWVLPSRYIKRPTSEFLHFHTKYGINQMLTPDHRVLCWRRVGRDRHPELQVLTAAEFAADHDRLTQGCKSLFQTSFSPVTRGILPLDDAQLRVQVMVMADGSLNRRMARPSCTVHVSKTRKIERAGKLLDDAGIAYTEHSYSNSNGRTATTIRFSPPILTKSYEHFWNASLEQLKVITEECFYWDGSEKDRVFFTRDKASADFMHYAFAASGYRAVLRSDIHNRDGEIDYRVFANTNTTIAMAGVPKTTIQTIEAEALAYCFTVPSGFLVLRRGGNIFMTGNCGMSAVRLDVTDAALPDNLDQLRDDLERSIPMGMGQGKYTVDAPVHAWMLAHPPRTEFSDKQVKRATSQMASLGGGNHFLEVCVDDDSYLWVMLHSGSRGIGHMLAQSHIDKAKKMAEQLDEALVDPELAWFVQGTPEFEAYIADMLWAQEYARANRDFMMVAALNQVTRVVGGTETLRINVHHNYANLEEIDGKMLWVTRKGAVSARTGELGIIPGSMATGSYIVEGLGNPDSYYSSPHGAGRRMSRGQARRELSVQDFLNAMKGKTWQVKHADDLLDEAPQSYKDLETVMADSATQVKQLHHLTQVINLKGIDRPRRKKTRPRP